MSPNPEDIRHATIEALAARHPTPLTAAALARRLGRELDTAVTPPAVESALAVLRDKGLVSAIPDELGSTKWWSATADGVLFVERGSK